MGELAERYALTSTPTDVAVGSVGSVAPMDILAVVGVAGVAGGMTYVFTDSKKAAGLAAVIGGILAWILLQLLKRPAEVGVLAAAEPEVTAQPILVSDGVGLR